MGRKGNISREERLAAKAKGDKAWKKWMADVETLRTKMKALWPEGDYRNDAVIHPLLLQIVCNFYGFKYEQGLFWYKDKSKTEMVTHIYAGKHIDHFLNYYLLDDGDLNKVDGQWRYTSMDDGMNKKEATRILLEEIDAPVTDTNNPA